MICPHCFCEKVVAIQASGAWAKCSRCNYTDLVTNFWKCPAKGKGCAKEDTCQRIAYQVKQCNLYPYMKYLWEFKRE